MYIKDTKITVVIWNEIGRFKVYCESINDNIGDDILQKAVLNNGD